MSGHAVSLQYAYRCSCGWTSEPHERWQVGQARAADHLRRVETARKAAQTRRRRFTDRFAPNDDEQRG